MRRVLVLWLAAVLSALGQSTEPGLTLSFTSGGKSDTRPARLAAFYVPAGQAPTPWLAPGPFTARLEGFIQSPLRAECMIAAEGAGTFKISINDQEIAADKSVRLNKGANKLLVEFTSPAEGDAYFRLLWSSAEFYREPVPPGVFTRPVPAKSLVREGRQLFAQLRCVACHDAGGPVTGMPERANDAPVLTEIASRFQENWLANWINEPHAIRPQTTMPRFFGGGGATIDQRAADLAAFLMTIGEPPKKSEVREDDVPAGAALFADLGCIACHTTPEATGDDEFRRVPLAHLHAKWQPAALAEYLREPQKYYQWTRMPNFRLSAEEAQRLTAFLLSGTQKEFAAAPKGDATRGATLLASTGCLNCHAGVPPTTAPKIATMRWDHGCLSDGNTHREAPDFGLTIRQINALAAFGKEGFDSLRQDTPAEFAQRQVANLRCNACHAIDAQASVWSQLEGEMMALKTASPTEGDEHAPLVGSTAPPLTFAGEKLRAEWAADFIAGKEQTKPRPWILARMPGFPAYASGLAAGLAHEHGFSVESGARLQPKAELAQAGAQLFGADGGFNCLQCHGLGAQAATAVFEAPGINLALAPARLRHEYYMRWVLFPQRIDPDTKMPKFADEKLKTPLTDILEGDATKQYDAIWHHLHTP